MTSVDLMVSKLVAMGPVSSWRDLYACKLAARGPVAGLCVDGLDPAACLMAPIAEAACVRDDVDENVSDDDGQYRCFLGERSRLSSLLLCA